MKERLLNQANRYVTETVKKVLKKRGKRRFRMIKKLLVSTLILGGVVAFAPTNVSAWTSGDIDPSDTPQVVDGVETGDVAVNGWIGEWDETDPGSPTDPEDPSAINVTIPTKVLYANSVDGQGAPTASIISPIYKIENNSTTTKLSIAVANFASKNAVDVKQDLSIKASNGAEVALHKKTGQMLSKKTYLTSLGTDAVDTFTFVGSVDPSYFPASGDAALRPEYQMGLHFTAIK